MPARERRYDCYGPFVKMAEADGWYLVRRPHRLPGAMHKKEWDRLYYYLETQQTPGA